MGTLRAAESSKPKGGCMRNKVTKFLTLVGEVATAIQQRRAPTSDVRSDELRERFDARHWAHITGESPTVQGTP